MAGQAERRRRRKEGLPPRPRLKFREIDVMLPAPAYEDFKKAHEAYLNRHALKAEEYGERAFAVHLVVVGAKHILAGLEKESQGARLVQPATSVSPLWAREASERLQAIKKGTNP